MMRFNGERWELFGPILEDAGPGGLGPPTPIETIGGKKRSAALGAADFGCPRHARDFVKPGHDDAYFGISPNVLPTGSTACRIRRESSTAAWRCFTASR